MKTEYDPNRPNKFGLLEQRRYIGSRPNEEPDGSFNGLVGGDYRPLTNQKGWHIEGRVGRSDGIITIDAFPNDELPTQCVLVPYLTPDKQIDIQLGNCFLQVMVEGMLDDNWRLVIKRTS